MSFFTARTTSRASPPRHDLSCSWRLWRRLIRGLVERGRQRSRESGAFLLGTRDENGARIREFILYDDLDPHALDTGIVRFDGRQFSQLWERCKRSGLKVVADIHVHPGNSEQSYLDAQHPMVSQAGHVSLIMPNFAVGRQPREGIGMYRYLGQKRWSIIPTSERKRFLRLSVF